MINYIKEITQELLDLIKSKGNYSKSGLSIFDSLRIISEEINKLEPFDFPPKERKLFVVTRQKVRNLARKAGYQNTEADNYFKIVSDLKDVLDNYGEYNSEKLQRDFSYVNDDELRNIIKRDYYELSTILLPDGAWKSLVIMAGSILEAILFDVLNGPKFSSAAYSSSKSKKSRLKSGRCGLSELISVAEDINVLPEKRVKSIDQVLRDYRNFVHPNKEIRSEHPCSEAEAYMAKGSLDGVCNHLETIV